MNNEEYFQVLKQELQKAYAVSTEARKKCLDPSDEVEIKITSDVAARVEGIVGPPGIAQIIRDLEQGGMIREDIAFEIAKKIVRGETSKKGTKEQLIEQAIRTGVGILTEGVLVAPTEGISKARIKENPDGSNYVAIYFSGPIRSAGGTAAALSVVLGDVARREAKVGDYRATDTQIERYVEEVNTYEARVNHLQYKPPDDDVRHVVRSCPVCVDGEPTEEIEVSAYRGVPGIETNRIRGGIPLVVCEGIAQKAAKVLKYTKKLNLDWDWLEKIIKIKKKEDKIEIKPDSTYLDGLVAGRPVFCYPSTIGGFRLRYGKSRTNGIMARNIHPATMVITNDFLAYGTHMKVERPGKGCVISGNELLEPPVVRLKNGSVTKVNTIEDAYLMKSNIEKILFLGDMLVTYGDFLKSNHPLIPGAWCFEWFVQLAKQKGAHVTEEMNAKEAFEVCRSHELPLHPRFTYNWNEITVDQLKKLREWIASGHAKQGEDGNIIEMGLKNSSAEKSILERLLVDHKLVEDRIVLNAEDAFTLLETLGINLNKTIDFQGEVLDLLKQLCGLTIKIKTPTYIGARMGRPEKSKERAMDGSPNALFPTGSQNRSITKIYKTLKARGMESTINLELGRFRCGKCNSVAFQRKCGKCGSEAKMERMCTVCNKSVASDIHCDKPTTTFDKRPVKLIELVESIKKEMNVNPNEVKGVKGLSNPNRVPERLEKGFIRAKHDVYVFRDGTSRFDSTDIPLTHFIPDEIGLSLERLKEIGYDNDYFGNPITKGDQLIPLRHQDILLSENGATYFMRVAAFIDEMLVDFYKIKPFYNVTKKQDLIGQLCIGLSPHTSAGVITRVIGFTKANVGYGHPYFHTAKRRNCDGDEDCLMLLMDGLLNFSREFLTKRIGGTMDTPLVLTPIIDPREVDDEVHSMEVVESYPLEFYEAAEKISPAGKIKVKLVKDMLGKPEQYENLPLTHLGGFIDKGPTKTKYVTLGSIPEKIQHEFELHEKIVAVDLQNTAERLILSHFIPDLYGNLRSFSRQTFRCVSCNTIYRRVPLAGKCLKCGGNLLLTINKGGIQKYLEISKNLCEKYDLPAYLKQRLGLVEKEIRSIFEDDKSKQMGLADFM